jgi:hypothetical protein
MRLKSMTIKEKCYYFIWVTCKVLTKPFYFIGNWAVDKLNKRLLDNANNK